MKIIKDYWNQAPENWTLDVTCGRCESQLVLNGDDILQRSDRNYTDGYGTNDYTDIWYFCYKCPCCNSEDSTHTKVDEKVIPLWVRHIALLQ